MTNKKKEMDIDEIREIFLEKGPDTANITVGLAAREARRKKLETEKKQISIRLDQDLIEEFKIIAGGRGYQSIINKALREWLMTNDMKVFLAAQFHELSENLSSQVAIQVEEKLKLVS